MKKAGIIYVAAGLVSLLLVLFVFLFQAPLQGKRVFVREGCTGCHSFRGHGGLGIDLNLTSQRRSAIWIMRKIKEPKKYNPDTRMPEYRHLSMFDRYALALYIRG